jgi:hypothetical protein
MYGEDVKQGAGYDYDQRLANARSKVFLTHAPPPCRFASTLGIILVLT